MYVRTLNCLVARLGALQVRSCVCRLYEHSSLTTQFKIRSLPENPPQRYLGWCELAIYPPPLDATFRTRERTPPAPRPAPAPAWHRRNSREGFRPIASVCVCVHSRHKMHNRTSMVNEGHISLRQPPCLLLHLKQLLVSDSPWEADTSSSLLSRRRCACHRRC